MSSLAALPGATRHRTGVVVTFDDPRGYGTIAGSDGDEVDFHCTAIADGTRTIEVGRAVAYEVVPGLRGRWEARGIV